METPVEDALSPLRNRLLALLPPRAYSAIQPMLEVRLVQYGEVLYHPEEPIGYVYFPLTSVCSLLVQMNDGDEVEGATIGREGFVGLPVLWGSGIALERIQLQHGGWLARMRVADFQSAVEAEPVLRQVLLLYTHVFVKQVTQSAACNRLHSTPERCARWLLMMHDRVERDVLDLTHDLLARMLGVRRVTVTLLAGRLQRDGLISYSRGRITIRDRRGLERIACECHASTRAEYERIFGQLPS
jgi:CRP-like cAMP-binding protein